MHGWRSKVCTPGKLLIGRRLQICLGGPREKQASCLHHEVIFELLEIVAVRIRAAARLDRNKRHASFYQTTCQ